MKIDRHTDLDVYKQGFTAAMEIFHMSKSFPAEERFSLTDQIRRSSRSVCANITEAWRKRRYPGSFIAKLCDSEGEAAETQTWLQFAVECGYISTDVARNLYSQYDSILGKLVTMINNPNAWTLPRPNQ